MILALVLIQALHIHVLPTRARRRMAHDHLVHARSAFFDCILHLRWQHFRQEQALSRILSKCVAILAKLLISRLYTSSQGKIQAHSREDAVSNTQTLPVYKLHILERV